MTDIVERLDELSGPPGASRNVEVERTFFVEVKAEIETLQAEKKVENERVLEIIQGYQSTIKRLNEGYDKITAVMAELGFGTWTDDDGTEWSLND